MSLRINSFEEYQISYEESTLNPEKFWGDIAATFQWNKKWDTVLDWNFSEPRVKWFDGGKMNITENMLDRHLEKKGDQIAFYWEPNDPNAEQKSITYSTLYHEVCKTANALKAL